MLLHSGTESCADLDLQEMLATPVIAVMPTERLTELLFLHLFNFLFLVGFLH